MPVQQVVDVGIPIEAVYNQFTQFEDWPHFMHRIKRATQDDDCTVSFAVKIWGKTKEFTANIDTSAQISGSSGREVRPRCPPREARDAR